MIFGKKLNRAQKWLREQNPDLEDQQEFQDEDLPSVEELRRESQQLNLDKSDMLAMIISAMITIIPACLIAILLIVGIAYFFFF